MRQRQATIVAADAGPSAHRQRLLAGMAAAIAERPYPQVTVADIVRHARTSRRTFYEHFADKQECLVALIEDSHRRVVAAIADAVDPPRPGPFRCVARSRHGSTVCARTLSRR